MRNYPSGPSWIHRDFRLFAISELRPCAWQPRTTSHSARILSIFSLWILSRTARFMVFSSNTTCLTFRTHCLLRQQKSWPMTRENTQNIWFNSYNINFLLTCNSIRVRRKFSICMKELYPLNLLHDSITSKKHLISIDRLQACFYYRVWSDHPKLW